MIGLTPKKTNPSSVKTAILFRDSGGPYDKDNLSPRLGTSTIEYGDLSLVSRQQCCGAKGP